MGDKIADRQLGSLFCPRAVALVAASDRSYLPRNLWKSVRSSGFSGGFYPVNPGREEAFGVKCRDLGADLQEFDVNPIGFYANSAAFRALDAKIVLTERRGDLP